MSAANEGLQSQLDRQVALLEARALGGGLGGAGSDAERARLQVRATAAGLP